MDQNEKLVMYGVRHICVVDGFSGKVVGFVTMPVKNNVEVYTHLFRYAKGICPDIRRMKHAQLTQVSTPILQQTIAPGVQYLGPGTCGPAEGVGSNTLHARSTLPSVQKHKSSSSPPGDI